MQQVTIVQRRLTHYRVPFFEGLREALKVRNIRLNLLVGQPTDEERSKRDGGHLDWAVPVETRYLLNNRLCWMPYYKFLRDTNLLIITQENWQIAHHWMLSRKNSFRVGFWGHGANLQRQGKRGWKDSYKDWTSTQVDWWFAYTSLSKQIVAQTGFSEDRITVVNNAIDDRAVRESLASVSVADVERKKAELGLANSLVGLFLGSLQKTKNLPFLYGAARKIKEDVPEFKLLIIGDGPEKEFVRQMTQSEPWIKWVGALGGQEKILCSLTADFMMSPGAVGLGILDSFGLGIPMVTTDISCHGPEIAYLNPDNNGLVSVFDMDVFANACTTLLKCPQHLARLRRGCALSASKFTLDAMCENFSEGIVLALSGQRH